MRPILLVLLVPLVAFACAESTPGPTSPQDHAATSAEHLHWTYSGDTGPAHWGNLDPSFGLCVRGAKQTPVDLPGQATATSRAPMRPQWAPIPLVMVNSGHTIQVDDTAPSSFTVDGTTYALAQFHFHSPAEHTIAGRTYDAELHLVHKSSSGKLLVVGVLFKAGAENAVLKPMFDAMPAQRSDTPTTVPDVTIDVASLLPNAPRYLKYDGSLTVPPCSEEVTWLVVEPDPSAPTQLSVAQIAKLRAATHGETNRPIQPLGGRSVTELL